jgi:RimJ/RimL family protein N-acetyltransferase
MTAEDLEQILEWNKNYSPEFLLQWSGDFEYPLTREQLLKFYHFDTIGTGRLPYKIIEAGQAIGIISLQLYREKSTGTIVKFLIGEERKRGKGIGQKALTNMVNRGFVEFSLRRIKLYVFDFNYPAIRCYEKVGFVKERLLKSVRKVEDNYWHMFEMSIFKDEWRTNNMEN